MKTHPEKTLLVGLALIGISFALIGAGSNNEVHAERVWLYPSHEQQSHAFWDVIIIEKTATSITFRPKQQSTIHDYGSVIEHHGNYTIEN